MHKVEIRLTNEGNDPTNVFEVFTEALGDKGYAESAPKQEISGGGLPIVMFLDVNDRVIVVAKGNLGQLVFDKEQNANIRVETEDQKNERAAREERMAKREADIRVEMAKGSAQNANEQALFAAAQAKTQVANAERDRAKLEEKSSSGSTAPVTPSGAGQAPPQTKPNQVKT